MVSECYALSTVAGNEEAAAKAGQRSTNSKVAAASGKPVRLIANSTRQRPAWRT